MPQDVEQPESDLGTPEETAVSEDFDSEAFEKTTAGRMAAVFDNAEELSPGDQELEDGQVDTDESEGTKKPESTDEPEGTKEPESTDEPEGTKEPESMDEPEGTEESEDTDDPDAISEDIEISEEFTLPQAYRRSLKARGWEDGEIDEFVKANPDLAIRTIERIHNSRSEEIAQFAALGRKSRQQQTDATHTDATEDQSVSREQTSQALKPIDMEAMVEKYGNDELVKEIIGPANAAIEQVNAVLPELRGSVAAIRKSRRETLVQQLEDFFGGVELQPFKPLYGSIVEAVLTDEQKEHRSKVIETADAIVAGATIQGRVMSVHDALLMAHDSVSSKFQEQTIRTTIKEQIKKRAKSVSVRPTHRTRDATNASPRTRGELERRVTDGLGKVFT